MPRKGSFGEISAIQDAIDGRSTDPRRPGYIIVKTFKQIREELDAVSKTQSTITRNGVLQIFEVGNEVPVDVDLAANSTGTSNHAARADHHHHLDEDIAPTWTSPHAWSVPQAELTDTVGAINVTATIPYSGDQPAAPVGVEFNITSPTSSATPTNVSAGINAVAAYLLAGYTGTGSTFAVGGQNQVAGTGTSVWIRDSGSPGNGANYGMWGRTNATTTGHNVGVTGDAFGGNVNHAIIGSAIQPKAAAVNVAFAGLVRNNSNSNGQIGLFLGIYGPTTVQGNFTPPTMSTNAPAVLICDNGSDSANVPLAKFCMNGNVVTTIARSGVLGINASATGVPTTHIPLFVQRNDSTTADMIQMTQANGTTVLAAFDPNGRIRQRETTTPSGATTDAGSHYTKDFAGRTELCYFDSAGVEVRLTSGGAVAMSLANPTASVGLTVVNGTATTGMRSDAAPPLDQSIAPTWTGLHTFARSSDAKSVRFQAGTSQTANLFEADYWDTGPSQSIPYFALGAGDGATNFGKVKIGYLGSGQGRAWIECKLNPTDAADSNVHALLIDIATTLSAANTLKITNSAMSKDYFIINYQGNISMGPATGAPDPAASVIITGNTSTATTLQYAFSNAISHDNGAVTPVSISGLANLAQVGTGTTTPTNWYAGIKSGVDVIISSDTTGASSVELGCVVGLPGMNSLNAAWDRPNAASLLRGNWKRVSAFRAGFVGSKLSGANLTSGARPLILSAVYAPISPYVDGTSGEAWGVEIASPTATFTPTQVPTSGGIKITHPNRNVSANYGTRVMHAYFSPYTVDIGGFSGNAIGDVTFDDGTYNQAGLYQYTDAWSKLLDQGDFVVWDNELVFYDDELVFP